MPPSRDAYTSKISLNQDLRKRSSNKVRLIESTPSKNQYIYLYLVTISKDRNSVNPERLGFSLTVSYDSCLACHISRKLSLNQRQS